MLMPLPGYDDRRTGRAGNTVLHRYRHQMELDSVLKHPPRPRRLNPALPVPKLSELRSLQVPQLSPPYPYNSVSKKCIKLQHRFPPTSRESSFFTVLFFDPLCARKHNTSSVSPELASKSSHLKTILITPHILGGFQVTLE